MIPRSSNGSPPNFSGTLVNVSIDAGADFVEIDFSTIDSSSDTFASGFQNTYALSFEGNPRLRLTDATIDSVMSNWAALTQERVSVDGNTLFVNVESLAFNRFNSVRIGLSAVALLGLEDGNFDGDDDIDIDDVDFLINNFGPTPSDEFSVLDLDGNGTVDAADLGQHIEILVGTSNGRAGTFLGDFNLDGRVDVLGDAFTLVGNLGTNVDSYADGDANGDGQVDVLNDAFGLVGNLGRTNTVE